MSPTFTTGKIKGMLAPMAGTIDKMIAHLDRTARRDSLVNIKPIFEGMAMDVIARCAFGIETNSLVDNSHELLVSARCLFDSVRSTDSLTDLVFVLFGSIDGIANYIPVLDVKGLDKLRNISKNIQDRREAAADRDGPGDFMDQLLEMRRRMRAGELPALSEDQVAAQGIVFFAAGFETTASTLGALCYNLVKNPEVRLRTWTDFGWRPGLHLGKIAVLKSWLTHSFLQLGQFMAPKLIILVKCLIDVLFFKVLF